MDFTYTQKREQNSFAQRSVVMSLNGMTATSQALAAQAGADILKKGGNAVDAAVAQAACLNVVEPYSVGIGGDAFALIYLAKEDTLLGMNASGGAPKKATMKWFSDNGFSQMPERGPLSITVPGAPAGWHDAQSRYGELSFKDVLEPAIIYAEEGFPVTEVIAGEWKTAETLLKKDHGAQKTYLINGKTPSPGDVMRNPDLARTFKLLAEEGPDVFYNGEMGENIVKYVQERGGLLSLSDLKTHKTKWVNPISLSYGGYEVFELPPNGQGVTSLEILNILSGYDIRGMGRMSPEYLHVLIEAIKIAFADRNYYITDPEYENIPVWALLSSDYKDACMKIIDDSKAGIYPSPNYRESDTIYAAAVDKDGNAVSFISSIYLPFGSGLVAEGVGVALHCRGSSFSLDPEHPNCLAPGKRPMHTIIPAMMFKNDRFLCSLGVMGGDMQPQGHAQLINNLVDFDMNLQEATDAPRVRVMNGKDVYFEDGVPAGTIKKLSGMGHGIFSDTDPVNMVGGAQAVYRSPESPHVLLGASDRRKDGAAVGF